MFGVYADRQAERGADRAVNESEQEIEWESGGSTLSYWGGGGRES